MNKKIKMLEVDIDVNNEKSKDVDKEINRIQKTKCREKHKVRKYCELSLKSNELKNLKTNFRNKIDALKQTIAHIEEVKDHINPKIKQLKLKIKNIPVKTGLILQIMLKSKKMIMK